MVYTRDMIIRMLAKRTDFYPQNVKDVFYALDDVIEELFEGVTSDEEVSIQFSKGIKIGCKVVGPRKRVNPQDQSEIMLGETVKPFAKWSNNFRTDIQQNYDNKKFEET